MSRKALSYFVALFALAMLPLAGCSGGNGGPPEQSAGKNVAFTGQVEKSGSKSVALNPYSTTSENKVFVIDAQDGKVLSSGNINADGKYEIPTFSLAADKGIYVLKANFQGKTFHSVVPIDLSNPPKGLVNSKPTEVNINSSTEAIAKIVSSALGLKGILGDGGQTLDSVKKTYADALTLVKANGGQILTYSGAGDLELTGNVGDSSLLPAKAYSDFTSDDVMNIKLGGSVTSAYIPTNNPVVNVTVTNAATGKGISGLPASKFTVHFAQLKADGSTWLNYMLTSATDRNGAGFPGTVTGNTVIDKGDGSYTIILNLDVTKSEALVASKVDTATKDSAKLTYDANLIHRVAISVNATGAINPATGAATASNPNNVAGLVYDFIPATGKQYVNPNGGNFARDLVTMASCDECHGNLVNHGHHFGNRPDTKICVVCHTVQNKKTGKPSAEFTNLIHTLHMGSDRAVAVTDIAGINASEIEYPQDQRNCAKCHTGKDSKDQVGMKPTQFACGSCHDGKTHIITDKACRECHAPDAGFGTNHITPISTKNNLGVPSGVDKFTFVVTKVSLDANKNAVIEFNATMNDAPLVLNTYAAGAELVNGYAGSPTLRVYYAVATAPSTVVPADFTGNVSVALKDIWGVKPTDGTLTVVTAGSYKATLLKAAVPDGAKMLTGTIFNGGSFAKGGVNVQFQQTSLAADPKDARRAIVTNEKCNACHEQLGQKGRGTAAFHHGGVRNDATMCAMCHLPTANYSASTFVHGQHAYSVDKDGKPTNIRTTQYKTYAPFGYPGVMRNCEQCHVAGSYDFSAVANREAAVNGRLGFVKNSGLSTGFMSPISAACYSCHDNSVAKSHMVLNGGIFDAATLPTVNTESCLVCHGPRGADTTLPVTGAVPTIKTVHRWW